MSIKKFVDGKTEITYNRSVLSDEEHETFLYGVQSLNYLIPRNSEISFVQFCELVSDYYCLSERIEEILRVFHKAAFNRRVMVTFKKDGKCLSAVVNLERWNDLPYRVEDRFGVVSDLHVVGMKYVKHQCKLCLRGFRKEAA